MTRWWVGIEAFARGLEVMGSLMGDWGVDILSGCLRACAFVLGCISGRGLWIHCRGRRVQSSR